MTILEELNDLLSNLDIPVEMGEFSGPAPDVYLVLTPLSDRFEVYGDNLPTVDICEVRISLFARGNYLELKKQITPHGAFIQIPPMTRLLLPVWKKHNMKS